MTVILPIIAVLSVTSEWSQRSGLTTFTLVPHRGRVVLAKAIVAVSSRRLERWPSPSAHWATCRLPPGRRRPPVWDQAPPTWLYFVLGNTLLLLVGFILGALIRNSSGAIVAYMVYAFVAPPLLEFLAFNQAWFRDLHPWVDPNVTQQLLFHGLRRMRTGRGSRKPGGWWEGCGETGVREWYATAAAGASENTGLSSIPAP